MGGHAGIGLVDDPIHLHVQIVVGEAMHNTIAPRDFPQPRNGCDPFDQMGLKFGRNHH